MDTAEIGTMASPAVLDFGAFSGTEKTALLAAAKAEYLARITGRVQSGSSAGQSYGMALMSTEDLVLLINALTVDLGYEQPEVRVRPNFSENTGGFYSWYDRCLTSPSRIEPGVGTWAELAALSTTGMPDGTIKIWVETATGITITVRLLPGTDATDTANGIQRPDDYANPGNARVWYRASS